MSAGRQLNPVIALSVAFLLACSDGGGPETTSVDDYVGSLGSWDVFSPVLPSQDNATADTTRREEIVQDVKYACTVTQHSLTDTPTDIVMYEPNASIMWVGNLIQGQSYKGGLGTFQELSIRQRAPLRLSIDLLTGNNFAVVDHPSLTTVQSAIGDLIQRAQDAGHVSGSSIAFDSRSTYSTRQAALKLGLSAKWVGGRFHSTLNVTKNASQRTILAHFVQKMFTISIELPQSPDSFFSDEFTPSLLQQQKDAGNIGPDNLPVYLASVTYGRTLTYSLTTSYSENRMRAAISASFHGFGGGVDGYTESDLRQTLSQENLRVVAIGGEGQDVLDLISQGNLQAYFTADAPLTTAKPISYQLNYLGDNKLARVSETTEYLLEDCDAIPSGDVVSDFEIDNEDWAVEGASRTDAVRVNVPPIVDGDWHVRGQDASSNIMYFRAPGKFRGDKGSYYGGNVSYFVRWKVVSSLGNGGPLGSGYDVMLIGANGQTLTYRSGLDDWPEDQWGFRQVALQAGAGWKLGSQLATEQQIRDVLANVLQLKIRGQYRTVNDGIGFLDRVILSRSPTP